MFINEIGPPGGDGPPGAPGSPGSQGLTGQTGAPGMAGESFTEDEVRNICYAVLRDQLAELTATLQGPAGE